MLLHPTIKIIEMSDDLEPGNQSGGKKEAGKLFSATNRREGEGRWVRSLSPLLFVEIRRCCLMGEMNGWW